MDYTYEFSRIFALIYGGRYEKWEDLEKENDDVEVLREEFRKCLYKDRPDVCPDANVLLR